MVKKIGDRPIVSILFKMCVLCADNTHCVLKKKKKTEKQSYYHSLTDRENGGDSRAIQKITVAFNEHRDHVGMLE